MADSWQDHALCKDHPEVDWFPIIADGGRKGMSVGWIDNLARARAVCAACPVATECLDLAFRCAAQDGIWAGMTPRQRRNEKRARHAAAG